MNIKPIRNDEDLHEAFERLELIFQAEEGSPEADERVVSCSPVGCIKKSLCPGISGLAGNTELFRAWP